MYQLESIDSFRRKKDQERCDHRDVERISARENIVVQTHRRMGQDHGKRPLSYDLACAEDQSRHEEAVLLDQGLQRAPSTVLVKCTRARLPRKGAGYS